MLTRYAALQRVVTFCGRMGGGKTLGAVKLADDLGASGQVQYIAANMRLFKWGPVLAEFEEPDKLIQAFPNTALIFDESWQLLGEGTSIRYVRAFLNFQRKQNCVLLLPSVEKLHSQVKRLLVERFLNLRNLGFPLWWYRYRLVSDQVVPRKRRELESWLLWFPQRYYSYYDTMERPGTTFYVHRWCPQPELRIKVPKGKVRW